MKVRRNHRARCALPATVRTAGATAKGVCRNVSLGGMWLEGVTLPSDSAVRVAIALPEGEVHAMGAVRRRERNGVGLQFNRFAPADLIRLHAFVAEAAAFSTPLEQGARSPALRARPGSDG